MIEEPSLALLPAAEKKRERAVAKPSRVYCYGALTPLGAGEQDFVAQIGHAHRFRNNLCELERARRAAVQEVLLRLRPDLAVLTAACELASDTLAAAVAAQKQRRSRTAAPGQTSQQKAEARQEVREESGAVRELRDRRRELYRQLRTDRTAAFASADVQEALASVENHHSEEQKRLYNECPAFWGTRGTVVNSCKSFRSGAPPKFARWNGEGMISCQLQGGLSVPDALLGKSNVFRLEIDPPLSESERSKTRRHGRAYVRIGSTGAGNRNPVWCVVPVVYHRDMPATARIKWVHLQRRQAGLHSSGRIRWRYELLVVLSQETEADWVKPGGATEGAVGIDLGWRQMGDGSLRVAYWAGSDGAHEDVRLCPKKVRSWLRSHELRSTRDLLFNEARDRLLAFLRDQATLVPEWLTKATAHLGQWRSTDRLARVVLLWGDQEKRFPGDEHIYHYLEGFRLPAGPGEKVRFGGWRRQDAHLLNWEMRARQRLLRWRLDLYRNLVARLREIYRTAAIEDCNWSQLMAHAPVEDRENENATARFNQRTASVGLLAEVISQGMVETVRIDPCNTTQRCSRCRRLDHFDAAQELVRVCQHCRCVMDQDHRAAENLLYAFLNPDASGEVVTD